MTRRAPSTSEWLLLFPRLLHAPSVLPSVSSSPLTRSHVPSAVSCIEIGGILGTLWCGGPLFSPSRLGYVSDAYHLSRAHICEAASILAGIVFAALPWASSPLAFLLLGFLLGFFLYIPFSFSELIAMESVDARLASTVISLNGLMVALRKRLLGSPRGLGDSDLRVEVSLFSRSPVLLRLLSPPVDQPPCAAAPERTQGLVVCLWQTEQSRLVSTL